MISRILKIARVGLGWGALVVGLGILCLELWEVARPLCMKDSSWLSACAAWAQALLSAGTLVAVFVVVALQRGHALADQRKVEHTAARAFARRILPPLEEWGARVGVGGRFLAHGNGREIAGKYLGGESRIEFSAQQELVTFLERAHLLGGSEATFAEAIELGRDLDGETLLLGKKALLHIEIWSDRDDTRMDEVAKSAEVLWTKITLVTHRAREVSGDGA